jgi:two-component system sensor histidine kinase KdpD
MTRTVSCYVEALLAVAAIAWLTSAQLPVLGLASSALLFLLPVLLAATRGGLGPGLLAALAGAAAYNFYLVEPRHTFRVHHLDNLVSIFVLVAVALVTSRLTSRLMVREAEALERARLSAEVAALSALLAGSPAGAALGSGVDFIAARYGELLLFKAPALPGPDGAFSSLDIAAAAWASHNGDATGHGTGVMQAADWTFLPLAARNRHDGGLAALARPVDGTMRTPAQLEHLRQLGLLLGQCIDRDALEAARHERALLEMRDHLRRNILTSLAHDFRTPLTVITGRLAELARHSADAGDALAAAQRLDRMMTDLIGAARIEAGSLTPALESTDLVDVVSAACETLAIPGHVSLIRDIAADLPFVRGDAVLLQHILSNLLDNAVRHARTTVTLAGARDRDRVLLRVSDDGPGVAPAERDRIFDRFARIEGSDHGDGSGLGLAIVKGFADAMGMAVAVDGAPSGGARFTLAMPIARSAEP